MDIFRANPSAKDADTIANLQAALQQVLASKKPHQMAVQPYHLNKVKEGDREFFRKFYVAINTPVLDEGGEVEYIIHKVEAVTQQVTQEQRLAEREATESLPAGKYLRGGFTGTGF